MSTTKKRKEWKVIRVEEQLYHRLKKVAKRRGESLSQLIWEYDNHFNNVTYIEKR